MRRFIGTAAALASSSTSRVGGASRARLFASASSSSSSSSSLAVRTPEYRYTDEGKVEWVDPKAAEAYFASVDPTSEEGKLVAGKSTQEILEKHVADAGETPVTKSFVEGHDSNYAHHVVTIERARFNAMQSPQYEASSEWVITFPRLGRWKNSLMGWDSFSDTLTGATALGSHKFATKDDALNFCRSKGMRYVVKDTYTPKNTMGHKSYGMNFLNYHITRMTKKTDRAAAQKQFAHPEAGKSCWVNLKHTPYGKKESENVSLTQWKDNQPRYHDAKGWAVDTRLSAELGRKLGK